MKAVKKTKAAGAKAKMAGYMKAQDGMTIAEKKAKKQAELEAKKKANKEATAAKAESNERIGKQNAQFRKNVAGRVSDLNSALSDYRALTPAERDGAQGAELRAQIDEIRGNIRGGALPGVQVAPTGKLRPGVMTGGTAVEREAQRKKAEKRGY